MDVQKYIKRLKFARADWSRNIGDFRSKEDALNFLNAREFFFGDPFVVKYTENGEAKLMLAIGKSENPEITADTTEVTGGVGPDAYELFDMNEFREAIEELKETTSGLTEDVQVIYNLIDDLTGSTADLEEIVGSGFTGHGRTITITDRIRKDEELAGISWHDGRGSLDTGRPHVDSEEVPYASGSTLMEMLLTVSDTLNTAVTFDVLYDTQHNILKIVYGDGHIKDLPLTNVSIVEYIRYDAATEELVIGYKSGEHGDVTEVRIPVRDILNEWETADTNTVQLTRVEDHTAGKDILTANVKISDDTDNMLTAKDDGLYVSDSAITSVSEVVDKLKEDLGTLEDGHLPTDYFSGDTINGSSNIQDALLKLDEAVVGLNSGVDELRNDLENTANTLNQKIDDEIAAREELAENVDALNSGLTELAETVDEGQEVTAIALNRLAEGLDQERQERIGGDMATLGMANARMDDIQSQLNDEKDYRKCIKLREVLHSDYEELGLGDDVRDAYFLTRHLPNSTTQVYEKPQPGDVIIKVYKDSVIYRIYFGHVDDTFINGETTATTDPTIVDGTGATAICFIYFDANHNYVLVTNEFNMGDAFNELVDAFNESEEVTAIALNRLAEAIMNLSGLTISGFRYFDRSMENMANDLGELTDAFNESEEVTAIALNRLAEGVAQAKTIVELESGTHHITLDRIYGPNGEDVYVIGEHHIADQTQVDTINNSLDNTIDRLDETNDILDNIKVILNTADDGHFTARFIGPHTSTAETYYDAINALDNAVDEAAVASRVVDFVYDSEGQDLVLTYTVNGAENTKRVDVSDFVKDSFLEGVQIVTHDGVQCLEFSFRTYDGQPLPIYVPLSDLAVLYSAGDGIDRDELGNQVITVKIDEFARKNYLAKSANGLLVTGVTEEIQEAVAAEAQARQEEDQRLWDALNQEISARTAADEELQEEIDDIMSSLSAFTADTIAVNDLTAVTANIENLYAENAQIDHITAQTIVTNEITGETAFFTGLTANTVYADEYQNLPTATTEQYGVVILDDHLDSASTRVVMNSAITRTILENEETTAAALNDLNNRKANRSELEAVENDLHNNYYNKAEVDEMFDEFEITVDDHLDSASTNPVENRVLYRIIVDDEEAIAAALNDLNDRKADITYVDAGDQNLQEQIDNIVSGGLTGVTMSGSGNVITAITKSDNAVVGHRGTVDTSNITAQTINTSAFTATTANIDNLTANTIVTNQITGNTANFTGVTANTLDVDNITAQTILTNTITGNTANFTGMTATTISATTYNNLPTASTTNYGMVILDDHLDSGSTHAVMNSAITQTIIENEEITAAALNDLNDRINNIRFDVDDHIDSASTNPVENRVLYQIIVDDEEAIAAALNDLNDRKADQTEVTNIENRVTVVEEAVETLSGGGLTGVTTSGSGNVVVSISKVGQTVQATLGNVDVTNKVDTTVFNTFTASTLNDVTTAGTGTIVTNVEKDGTNVKVTKTNQLNLSNLTANTLNATGITATTEVVNNLTANTINATGVTATTVSATTYNNLPTASTTNYGVVIMDDHLDTGSTHAVMNSAITQTIIQNELITAAALNDLNDRKANVEDIPVTINDLDGAGDLALKTDLAGFLPLSGGTMTGNISGETGCSIFMPGGFFQQSDETLKIFMGDVENALEKANKIPTKYFYWKDRYDGPRELGTSAQKVQEVFPEIVSGGDKLSVDYSKLAIVALAAIKELTAKVEDLQNQLDELKK